MFGDQIIHFLTENKFHFFQTHESKVDKILKTVQIKLK